MGIFIMINCFLYQNDFKNRSPVWNYLTSSLYKRKKLIFSQFSKPIYTKLLNKNDDSNCFDNNEMRVYNNFAFLNEKKFRHLCTVILTQLIISVEANAAVNELKTPSESTTYLLEKKENMLNKNKFLTADIVSIDTAKLSNLPVLKRASELLREMDHHVSRPVKDALILLLATVFVVPLMRKFNTSPILGFLAAGLFLGPNGFGLIHRIGASKTLAEFGVVFFLFEMGLELSLSRLKSLGMDVFGLGSLQWLITGIILALISLINNAPIEIAIVIGFGLALSSSAFVLQLLSERGEVGTRFGRASFGILLFQDLAVVPLLAVGGGDFSSLLKALGTAAGKAAVALGIIFLGEVQVQNLQKLLLLQYS